MLLDNDFDCNRKFHYTDLYDNVQKLHYRVGGKDDRLMLNIRVSSIVKYGLNDEKILSVVITDNNNPLLLFSTEIDSEIYSKLKQKLDLLIDFSQFPCHLVNLLSQCSNNTDMRTQKYNLMLEELNLDPYDIIEGRCILFKIVEVNQFQRICVIAVHMVSGSETEINSFMARSIQLLKHQNEDLQTKVFETERKCKKIEEHVESRNIEMERLRAQKDEQVIFLKSKHEKEMCTWKQNCESLKNEYERKIKFIIAEQEKEYKLLQIKFDEILQKHQEEMKEIEVSKDELNSELIEKNECLNKLHNDIRILQNEILKSESKISLAETETKEKNMLIVNLKQHALYLEKEKEDKEKTVRRLTLLLETANSNRNQLKTALKEKVQLMKAQKDDLSLLTKDLFKANDIIIKITKENKQIKNKLSDRTNTILQQEKLLKSLQDNCLGVEVFVKEKCERIRALEIENKTVNDSLKIAEENIKLKEETIRKNERVIGWLNDIVSKQEAIGSQIAVSSRSSSTTTSFPPADSNSLDKKLLQLTAVSVKSSKSVSVNNKNISSRNSKSAK